MARSGASARPRLRAGVSAIARFDLLTSLRRIGQADGSPGKKLLPIVRFPGLAVQEASPLRLFLRMR
jgi:hypothetical protein